MSVQHLTVPEHAIDAGGKLLQFAIGQVVKADNIGRLGAIQVHPFDLGRVFSGVLEQLGPQIFFRHVGSHTRQINTLAKLAVHTPVLRMRHCNAALCQQTRVQRHARAVTGLPST